MASSRPLLLVACALSAWGCSNSGAKPVPLDRPVFPTGLALSPDGNRLLVASSNFDFSYDSGAVLLGDVGAGVDKLLADRDPAAVVAAPWLASALVPEFADRLVFDAAGASALFTTRDGNLLHEVRVDGDTLSCGVGVDFCNTSPSTLQLAGNDPFDVLVLADDGVILRGLVSHLGSPQAEIFNMDRRREDAGRLTIERADIDFTRDVAASSGVRSTTLRPARAGKRAAVFAAVERRENGVLLGVDLVQFGVPAGGRGGDVSFVRQDLTELIGPRSVRDMAIVSDDVGGDALVVLLQNPDAIVRFSIDDADDHLTLTAVESTCLQPLGLAVAPIDADGDAATAPITRLLVTCHGADEVIALDPRTLQITDASRFFGRGPYDVVVDTARNVAFVSFFLDDSIGVFSLVDDGEVRLTPVGRLGAALPPAEDGRE